MMAATVLADRALTFWVLLHFFLSEPEISTLFYVEVDLMTNMRHDLRGLFTRSRMISIAHMSTVNLLILYPRNVFKRLGFIASQRVRSSEVYLTLVSR